MTNYRKILEMQSQGHSQRSIEASFRCSHQTVSSVLDRAQELNITWPLDDDVTNEALTSCSTEDAKAQSHVFVDMPIPLLPSLVSKHVQLNQGINF